MTDKEHVSTLGTRYIISFLPLSSLLLSFPSPLSSSPLLSPLLPSLTFPNSILLMDGIYHVHVLYSYIVASSVMLCVCVCVNSSVHCYITVCAVEGSSSSPSSSLESAAAGQLVEAIRNKKPVEELLQVLESCTASLPAVQGDDESKCTSGYRMVSVTMVTSSLHSM